VPEIFSLLKKINYLNPIVVHFGGPILGKSSGKESYSHHRPRTFLTQGNLHEF
jgi:hypothetical protein